MTGALAIFGGGNMGAALAAGMLRSASAESDSLVIVEPVAARRETLVGELADVAVVAEPPTCTAAVIAVKPGDVPAATAAAAAGGAERILSVAAGVTIDTLRHAAGDGVDVVRAMPNTPALVGRGVTAIAGAADNGDDTLDWAESILSGVGLVVRVAESQLDAVTGLTGSGPAYVFLVAEALIDAGVAAGLPRAAVEPMVAELLLGSATLLAERGDAAGLRAMVTSPGGTTAAGLGALEERAVRAAFAAAVAAATERSRQLGGG